MNAEEKLEWLWLIQAGFLEEGHFDQLLGVCLGGRGIGREVKKNLAVSVSGNKEVGVSVKGFGWRGAVWLARSL